MEYKIGSYGTRISTVYELHGKFNELISECYEPIELLCNYNTVIKMGVE